MNIHQMSKVLVQYAYMLSLFVLPLCKFQVEQKKPNSPIAKSLAYLKQGKYETGLRQLFLHSRGCRDALAKVMKNSVLQFKRISPCRMSILRKGLVAVSNLGNGCVTQSI